MQKRRHVVMLPSSGTPPVGDLADLVLARLASGQPIPKPPLYAYGRVPRR